MWGEGIHLVNYWYLEIWKNMALRNDYIVVNVTTFLLLPKICDSEQNAEASFHCD